MKYLQKLMTNPVSGAIELDEHNVPTEQIFLKLINSNEVPYISKPSYIDVTYDFGEDWNDDYNIFGENLNKYDLYAICIDGVFRDPNTINRKFNFSDGGQHTVRFYFKYNNYIQNIVDSNINNEDDSVNEYPYISIDFNNFNAQGLVNINDIFSNSGITDVYGNLGSWDVSNVRNMSHLFEYAGNVHNIKSIRKWDVSNVTNMSNMFKNRHDLTNLNLSNWDVSNVTNMSGMFYYCNYLTSLNLNGWNASASTNMSYMFYNCESLTNLNLNGWDANAANMSYMFHNCDSLTNLNLSNWNTSACTDMSNMFYGCTRLSLLGDLSGWNTSACTNMSYMFLNCFSLTNLNYISGWNVSNVTNMMNMFSCCCGLTSLDLSNWNVSNVENMFGMFIGCSGLTNLDLSGWNTSACTDMSEIFYDCKNLTTITLSDDFFQAVVDYFDFSSCPWSHDSIILSLITNQVSRDTSKIANIVLSDTSLNTLSSEEISSIKALGFKLYTYGDNLDVIEH